MIQSELNINKPFVIKSSKDVDKYFKEIINPAFNNKYKNIQEFINNPGNSEQLTNYLKKQGYDSIIDKDGYLSLELIGVEEPQIIVLDLEKIKNNKELYTAIVAAGGAGVLQE